MPTGVNDIDGVTPALSVVVKVSVFNIAGEPAIQAPVDSSRDDEGSFLEAGRMLGAPTVRDVEDSQLGDDRISNVRAFLRLFAGDVITVKNLDIRNYRGDAIIVAREVVFDNFSSIKIGNKNLFIFANTLQSANGRSGIPIYAYAQDDVPSELGLEPGEGRARRCVELWLILGDAA
ncbi:hypothetical protein [Bradyrhizobium sp. Tv2a-2]|uniref:hypothetical protein n=1 Tax=Bradyrhizobium sp. Tv2a-2 TaxID=113395 RepID=UPI000465EF22|nr:hypothetical protein [Bradyrhizobium sp. Tv2a-2]